MNKILKTSLVLLTMSGLASCSSLPFGKDSFNDSTYAAKTQSSALASGSGADASFEEQGNVASAVGADGKYVMYFKFDNATVPQSDYQIIREQAKYLASHPEAQLYLDGHTDERGSREYNLALGERRAKSVAELLKLQGANPKQIKIISYGQEKPSALGHNEDSWRLNRRVEFKATV